MTLPELSATITCSLLWFLKAEIRTPAGGRIGGHPAKHKSPGNHQGNPPRLCRGSQLVTQPLLLTPQLPKHQHGNWRSPLLLN